MKTQGGFPVRKYSLRLFFQEAFCERSAKTKGTLYGRQSNSLEALIYIAL